METLSPIAKLREVYAGQMKLMGQGEQDMTAELVTAIDHVLAAETEILTEAKEFTLVHQGASSSLHLHFGSNHLAIAVGAFALAVALLALVLATS